jgi:hypothetical protein
MFSDSNTLTLSAVTPWAHERIQRNRMRNRWIEYHGFNAVLPHSQFDGPRMHIQPLAFERVQLSILNAECPAVAGE